MTVLIPMAGRGERFRKENYSLPKPLLPVDGLPMVVKAATELPVASKYIFVMLREHIETYNIDNAIQEYIPQAFFLTLDHVTEGQASTCLYALEHNEVKDDLLIGACDNGMIFQKEKFEALKNEADVLVFTFRNNTTVTEKPQQYGWVEVDDENNVINVSVKKPISSNPINDHAVVGAFWFKSANIFKSAVDKMVQENRKINNEFYVDESMNDAVELGYGVKVFEIEKYICWGTPDDYKTYNYWKGYFLKY